MYGHNKGASQSLHWAGTRLLYWPSHFTKMLYEFVPTLQEKGKHTGLRVSGSRPSGSKARLANFGRCRELGKGEEAEQCGKKVEQGRGKVKWAEKGKIQANPCVD